MASLHSEGIQGEAEAVSGSTAAPRLDLQHDQLGFTGDARRQDILQAVQEAAVFALELLPAFATVAGLEATVIDTRIVNLILGLNARKFDVVTSVFYSRTERAKQIDFSPHMKTGVLIGIRKHPRTCAACLSAQIKGDA